MLGRVKMHAFNFVDENKQKALYWRDVGTLDAYYEANMDVAGVTPIFNLYDKSWPMRTRAYQYPPAKFVFGEIGPHRYGDQLDRRRRLHRLRLGRAQLGRVPRCPRELLC